MDTPPKNEGFRQYRSFGEAMLDPRLGTLEKIRIGMVASQIKASRNPRDVRQILGRNRELIKKLQKKGIISAEDVEEIENRLKELEDRGESFDFKKIFE